MRMQSESGYISRLTKPPALAAQRQLLWYPSDGLQANELQAKRDGGEKKRSLLQDALG